MSIRFPGSPKPTLGVEIELQTIDPQSGALVSAAPRLLQLVNDPIYVKKEVLQCVVEVCTPVCRTVRDAEMDLSGRLRHVIGVADSLGVELVSAGTHPFSTWQEQKVSEDARYFEQIERVQWTGRRLLTFGLHVHVGVASAEKAIAITNSLSTFIPHLLALSGASPFWEGRDTGLASARSKVFESLPGGGFPYRMTNWTDFQRMMRVLMKSQTIHTINEIWWDIRPHIKYGTVEVRICDALPTVREIGAIAAFVQCLVVWMANEYDLGHPLPVQRYWVLRENKWRAARFGLRANLVTDDRGYQCGIRALIEAQAEELLPLSHALGCTEQLERLWDILDAGTSAQRQREVFRQTGNLRAVVKSLALELRDDVGAALTTLR